MIDAIIPVFNEAQTVGGIVDTVVRAGVCRRVVVVDDGSSDGSEDIAGAHGAHVVRMPMNMGKGQAMKFALSKTNAPWILMCDADLQGLRVDHVRRFVDGARAGYDMTCGLRDYGLWNPLQAVGPLITGERLIRRAVLERVPANCWDGYAIETGINATMDRVGGRTCLFVMDGVTIRTKLDKSGFFSGLAGQAKMFFGISNTKESLRQTCGTSCRI